MSKTLLQSALQILIKRRNAHRPDRATTRALIHADIRALRCAA